MIKIHFSDLVSDGVMIKCIALQKKRHVVHGTECVFVFGNNSGDLITLAKEIIASIISANCDDAGTCCACVTYLESTCAVCVHNM